MTVGKKEKKTSTTINGSLKHSCVEKQKRKRERIPIRDVFHKTQLGWRYVLSVTTEFQTTDC